MIELYSFSPLAGSQKISSASSLTRESSSGSRSLTGAGEERSWRPFAHSGLPLEWIFCRVCGSMDRVEMSESRTHRAETVTGSTFGPSART